MMKTLFIILCVTFLTFSQTVSVYNVKDYGAKGDGISFDTKALQESIDKCSVRGGTVLIPPGKYLTGSLVLKSNVDIYLQNGSTILGSPNLSDYESHIPELKSYNDIFLRYSLFYAENAVNITIKGEGIIDGQGASFKVLSKKKPDKYKNRPFIIRFINCSHIKIEGITLRNSAMWMQQYLACENLLIHGINVFNHANLNNDMMDIDGCKNVIISDCTGDTDDDGITLKSTSPYPTENVTINNCLISSHCNAIKIGTESTGGFHNINFSNIVVTPSSVKKSMSGYPGGISGITFVDVDGGNLDGVQISNIRIDGPKVPIFLLLGDRGRKYTKDSPKPPVGSFRNVSFSNISADNVSDIGCLITGISEHDLEGISLNNIKINFPGGVNNDDYAIKVPEFEKEYPEATMWNKLPAYGFFIRHVKNIKMNNIELTFMKKDDRPAIVLDNVNETVINGLIASLPKKGAKAINIRDSQNIHIENSTVIKSFSNEN